jgi:hypothetical protein
MYWQRILLTDQDISYLLKTADLSGHAHQPLRTAAFDKTRAAIPVVHLNSAGDGGKAQVKREQLRGNGRDENFLFESTDSSEFNDTGYA